MKKNTLDVKFYKDPCCLGYTIFENTLQSFNPGMTILVGCNGYGKTTALKTIQDFCDSAKIPCISYSDRTDGKSIMDFNFEFGDSDRAICELLSSEGERISIHIGDTAAKIGRFIKDHKSSKKIVVLLDSLDSGLSIDGIQEFKHFVNTCLIPDCNKNNIQLYVIVTANAYELVVNEECHDVFTGKKVRFNSYNEYSDFVLKTRQQKDKRLDSLQQK